ncbi:MAG: hypothetical protein APF82_07500 [Sphingomonadales bacterium BRH_c42]|nr:MAG: hypothetical protein APF82_07500 [Sphingomonadales bacterium BRH_c42]
MKAAPHGNEVEAVMRQELALGDRALASVAPVLGHLLASPGQSLVSDDLVARMRGMLADIARQLLVAQAQATSVRQVPAATDPRIDALTGKLANSSTLLSHCYALAMEGLITRQLEQQAGIDPVLSPLMQELIASSEEATSELAMTVMASQVRFMQSHRRMNLPLADLTADLFHEALQIWSSFARADGPEVLFKTEARLRKGYDEGASRPGLLSRLVATLRGDAKDMLALEHAGFALFSSIMASATRRPRELAVLACHERQVARLALTLRAAGLDADDVARQIMVLHSNVSLPDGFAQLTEGQALELLGSSSMDRQG